PQSPPPQFTSGQRLAAFKSFLERRAYHHSSIAPQTHQGTELTTNPDNDLSTSVTKVFVWKEDLICPEVYHRVAVSRHERERTLARYSSSQKVYDMVLNEWDCCSAADDVWDNENGYNDNQLLSPLKETPDSPPYDGTPESPLEPSRQLTPPPTSELQLDRQTQVPLAARVHCSVVEPPSRNFNDRCDNWQEEFLDILHIFYGYTPPLPYPVDPEPISDDREAKKVLIFYGEVFQNNKVYYLHRPVLRLASRLMPHLLNPTSSTPLFLDTFHENRSPVLASWRASCLHLFRSSSSSNEVVYVFDFGTATKAPWHLGVTQATIALAICRLPQDMDEFQIAQYLLQRGIAFKTLQNIKHARLFKAQRTFIQLPKRNSKHTFGPDDYNAYVAQRHALLKHPRGRVALMAGGYPWRLALDTVSFDTVLSGPAGWSENHSTMFTAHHPQTGKVYFDDALTIEEFDLICGAYVINNPNGQPSLHSWFPLHSTWSDSNSVHNHWTPSREKGYADRMSVLASSSKGKGKPENAKYWRDNLRSLKELR
ncbi:hypothetical protein H0H81_004465, partial [Sphagnurus paluster]